MEQHAVPQDITGFKFKLVGDMTLKQFGELAGGAVLAYIFYASGLHPILKWPLVFTFGLLGFALAFLPIEERPLDIWLANFFRAIYQPTLYLWKKNPGLTVTNAAVTSASPDNPSLPPTPVVATWPFPDNPSPPEEKKIPPEAKPESKGPLAVEDLQRLRDQKIAELENATKKLKTVTTKVKEDTYRAQKGPGIITVDELAHRRDDQKKQDEAQLHDLLNQNLQLGNQIEAAQTRIQALEGTDTSQLQTQMDNLLREKDQLAALITSLQNKVGGNPPSKPTPTEEAQIRVVEKSAARQTNITLTDVPNIINGIITDEKGVPLDSTILTVKDQAGNSIRALKTNQIGQFIASTPLENGTYYLEFERPNYLFDTLEITLDGKVIAPLEIYGHH